MKLSNKYRPIKLQDVVGQPLGTGSQLDTLIAKFKLGEPGACLWIDGPPGTGKTSLVEAYVRTLFCEQRAPGSHVSCGVCPICTAPSLNDISPENITYYACRTADESLKYFQELLIQATMPPLWPTTTRPDQFYRVIVVDEVQNASTTVSDRVTILLDEVERCPPTTIWCFLTSHPESLDPKTLSAISSRCLQVNFQPLSAETMATRMHSCVPELSLESAQVIAQLSGGNLRNAWSEYEGLETCLRAGDIPAITPSVVYSRMAGGADNQERAYLWRLLGAGELTLAAEVVSQWCARGIPRAIGGLLLGDLNQHLSLPGVPEAALALAHWISRGARGDTLGAVLAMYPVRLPLANPRSFKELLACCT